MNVLFKLIARKKLWLPQFFWGGVYFFSYIFTTVCVCVCERERESLYTFVYMFVYSCTHIYFQGCCFFFFLSSSLS